VVDLTIYSLFIVKHKVTYDDFIRFHDKAGGFADGKCEYPYSHVDLKGNPGDLKLAIVLEYGFLE
jgi:hypothetical protein